MVHDEGMETSATTSTTALVICFVIIGLIAVGGLVLIAMAGAGVLH